MDTKRIRNESLESARGADKEEGSRPWVAKKLLDIISAGPDGKTTMQADVIRATNSYTTLMGYGADSARDYERMNTADLLEATKRLFLPIIEALGAQTLDKRKAFRDESN